MTFPINAIIQVFFHSFFLCLQRLSGVSQNMNIFKVFDAYLSSSIQRSYQQGIRLPALLLLITYFFLIWKVSQT